MKNSMLFLFFCILFVCVMPNVSQSCTTFCLDNNDKPIFGKNQDSSNNDLTTLKKRKGLMIVNKRGVSKTAMENFKEPGVGQPVSWISKFGSVTFNRVGREFPFGGMNEAGLVVELFVQSPEDLSPLLVIVYDLS